MINLPNTDDDDDYPEDFDSEAGSEPARTSAAAVIGRLSLETSLDRSARTRLKHHPCLTIVTVPDAGWIDIIEETVKRMDRAPIVKTVIERHKSGNALQRVGGDELRWTRSGRSLLFITPDPEALLAETVLAAADVTVAITPPTPELLRRVIREVTGGIARGVTQEMAMLDSSLIISVIRPDLTARQCADNLRRTIGRRPPRHVPKGPLLDELPLTDSVRIWSDQMLADMNEVKAGTLAPDRLEFGVLEGPPRTGKTLIIESLARSAGWNLVQSSDGGRFTIGDGALGGVARNLSAFVEQV